MVVADKYARSVWEAESMLATWTPDRHLAVGDIVSRERNGLLRVETRLPNLVGDPLPAVTETRGAATTLLQSGLTVERSADAAAPVGTARIGLSGRSSFLFSGRAATLSSFETITSLRKHMTRLALCGDWEDEWHLVIAVQSHAAGTVIIAESDEVHAEIRIKGPRTVDSLAGIRAGGQVSVTSGRAATFTMARCTPFYEALKVRRRLVAGLRVETTVLGDDSWVGTASGGPGHGFDVARVSLGETGLVAPD